MTQPRGAGADVALAVAYAAKSSPDEKDSIADQLAAIRSRADDELGRLVIAEFAEANRSGWRGNRGPQLEAALAKVVELAGEYPSVELWVWHSSRLGRGSGLKGEARSLMEVFTYLRRRGVTLRSVDDDQFVTSPMLVGFAAELAEKYSSDLSGWVMAGKNRQWQRGDWIGGPIPDGYRSDGQRGLELDPQRAPLIRRVFELAIDGIPCAAIARQLNADGLRTREGGAWTRRRVQDTLSNAVYAGLLVRWRGTAGEERRPGHHTPIATIYELEAIAQLTRRRDKAARGRSRGGRPSRRFLLASLGRCARCGGRMYSRTSPYKRKDGTHARAYHCRHVVDGTGLCDAPPVNAVAVDARVLDRLPRFIEAAERWLHDLGSDHKRAEQRASADVAAAERRVREVQARVAALSDRYQLEAQGDLMTSRAEALLDALVEARTELKRAHAHVRAAHAELDAVRQAIEGDPLAVACQRLKHALVTEESTAVAELNKRLREHFDAFVIDADGSAVPIWRVQVPSTLASHIADVMDADGIAAYVERRVTELGLVDALSETGKGSQA